MTKNLYDSRKSRERIISLAESGGFSGEEFTPDEREELTRFIRLYEAIHRGKN